MSDGFFVEALTAQQMRALDLSGLALYPRYRGFRGISADDHVQIFRGDAIAMLEAGGICHGYVQGGRLVAVCSLSPLAWDSRHFDLPMAKLMLVAAPGTDQVHLAEAARASVAECARRHGSRHFSADLDLDDYLCLNALLSQGFEILDVKRTYRGHKFKEGFVPPRMKSAVREYRESDHDDVARLVREADIASRFTRDRFLSAQKSRELYQLWFEQLLSAHKMTSIARVYEKAGCVVACGVIGELDFSRYGVDLKVMADGLYASGRAGVGAYFPILHDLTISSFERHGLVQTTVSMNNQAAVRVLDSLHYHGGTVIRYALRLFLGGD